MKVVLGLLWFLYFLQGIPYGFQTKYLPVFLRSHSLSLSLIGLTRLLSLPWILKPFWAPLIDRLGTKTSWITFNLFGMACCYLIASCFSLNNILLTIGVVAGLNILASTQDIAVDSIIVDLRSKEDIGVGNIAQVVGYKTGSLVGGGLLGWLSSSLSWQSLFFLLFLVYFTSAVIVFSPFFLNLATPQLTMNKERDSPQEAKTREVSHTSSTFKSHKISDGETLKDMDTTPRSVTTEDFSISQRKREQQDLCMEQENKPNKRRSALQTYYNIYTNILKSPGTKWTIVYVLIYKLGEQGIIAMFPMSLMDQGLSASKTAVLTGIWCQLSSISGSLLGGMIISSVQWSSLCNTLTTLCTARLLVATVLTWIGSWNSLEAYWLSIVFFDCILHFISGAVTTVTFTLMVKCSQQCPSNISATHYSTLATFEVLGKLIMIAISGSITEKTGYDTFFIICVVLLLFPIILLKIPSDLTKNRDKVKI